MTKFYLITLFFCLAFIGNLFAQAPVISSFNPISGNVGTTVTITGNNFDASPGNNIVYFGGVKATVSSATATTLKVVVPSGSSYQPISVLNAVNNLTGYAAIPFVVTLTSKSPVSASEFDPKVVLPSGLLPSSSNLVDLDQDGKLDLVVTCLNSEFVSVYRNVSSLGVINSSSFAPSDNLSYANVLPSGVTIGDMDGDGKPDVIISYSTFSNGSGFLVLHNTSTPGNISFATPVKFLTPGKPVSLAIDDIDGDGKPDVITIAKSSGTFTLSAFLNTSAGGTVTSTSFPNKVDLITGTTATTLSISDINTDGKPDIILVNRNYNTISLMRNTSSTGSITFDSKVDFASGESPQSVSVGDFNADGKPDLAVANSSGNTVSVYLNTATSGSFTASSLTPKTDLATGIAPSAVNIADIDGDGKPDIVTGNTGSSTFSILRNITANGNTSVSFAAKIDISEYINPYSTLTFALGDIDRDGKPDMVVTNDAIAVFRNNPQIAPAISSISPAQAAIGANVIITGNNFNTTAAKNIVYFGNVKATVSNASATQLNVTVPAGAGYGLISVLNTDSRLSGYSSNSFDPMFASKRSLTASDFELKTNLGSLQNISGMSFADLDGDGKPDMVVLNNNNITPAASVYRNISVQGTINAASFSAKTDLKTGGDPGKMIIMDVDGDGKPDIMTLNSGSISVFQNQAVRGTLDATSFTKQPDVGVSGTEVEIADIDEDGKPDLIVPNKISLNRSGAGSIAFSNWTSFDTGQLAQHLCIGDIDGDGKPDILQTNSDNTISIFQNNSVNGTVILGSKIILPTANRTVSTIKLADINGDGKPDLIIGTNTINGNQNIISVYLNTSAKGSVTASTFAFKTDIAVGLLPFESVIADVNGDGKADIVINNSYGASINRWLFGNQDPNVNDNNISVLLNNSGTSNVSFASKVDLITGITDTFFLNIGDIDGDNKPDILYSDKQSIYALHCNQQLAAVNPPPPVITSFTPANGLIGANVVINGSNFNGVPASNVVYFGATKGQVLNSTNTQITVKVPPGSTYSPLSVTSTSNGLTGYSLGRFSNIFKSSGVIDTSVFKSTELYSGWGPGAIAIGDLDGDGKPDIVLGNRPSNNDVISVYPNNSASAGDFTFKANINYAVPSDVSNISLTDIDGDGKLDILVSYVSNGNFSVFLNKSTVGNISFAPKTDIGFGVTGIAIGDLNGDGKIDLAGIGAGSNLAFVMVNTSRPGKISFSEPITFGVTIYTNSNSAVNILDVDGDSKPDLVIANSGTNMVSVFRNTSANGGIAFESNLDFRTSGAALLKNGDLDGDGKPDLITSATFGGKNTSVSVLINNSSPGKIAFQSSQDFVAGDDIRAIDLSDVNGDGKVDIVTANAKSNLVSVLRNKSSAGTAMFSGKTDFKAGQYPQFLAIGDLDGDGTPDIAASYDEPTTYTPHNGIVILENKIKLVPVPTITANGPLTFSTGGNVVLTAHPDTGYTYQWAKDSVNISGAVKSSFTAKQGGSYTVTISLNGVSNTSTATVVTVLSFPVPTITANGPLTFVTGGNVVLSTSTGTGYIYQWAKDGVNINGATNASFTATQSGSYTVSVSLNGTSATSAATVVNVTNILAPTITANGPLTFNTGGNVVLSTSAGTGYTYQWAKDGVNMDGATNLSLTVTQSGSYTVTVSLNGANNTSAATVINVVNVPVPTITPGGPLTFADGGNVLLTASSGTGYTYQWAKDGVNINGATNASFSATQSGSYTVTISLSGVSNTSAATVVTVQSASVPPAITTGGTLSDLTTFYGTASSSTNFSVSGTNLTTGVTVTAPAGFEVSSDNVNFSNQITFGSAGTLNSTTIYIRLAASTSVGSYIGDISLRSGTASANIPMVYSMVALPADNYKITINSATCRGSDNGSVNITASQTLDYVATISGNGISTPYSFTNSVGISNLAPGPYSVCITVEGQPSYQQCYDVTISEPQDLSVYSTVNSTNNTLSLALTGAAQYNIELNGKQYTTTNNSITLPLNKGSNDLTVTTDKLCQGIIQKTINMSGVLAPYPNPFQNVLDLNIGDKSVNNLTVEIQTVTDGRLVYSKQYVNQSGVLRLDLSNLMEGTYILQLSMDNSEQIFKILKK